MEEEAHKSKQKKEREACVWPMELSVQLEEN